MIYLKDDQFGSLMENLPEAFSYFQLNEEAEEGSCDPIFLYVNKTFQNMSGYQADTLVGKTVAQMQRDEHNPLLDWIIACARVLKGESVDVERYFGLKEKWYRVKAYTDRSNHYAVLFQDITEQKKEQNEDVFQSGLMISLMDAIPDIIFYKDANGVYLGCNRAFCEHVGLKKSDIMGKTDYDIYPKQEADFFRKNDALMMEQKQARSNEEWINYPDGKKVLIDTLKTPIWSAKGQLLGLIGISRDITDRKRTEELLRLSEERFSKMLEVIPDMISIHDSEMNIVYSNWNGFAKVPEEKRVTYSKCYKTYRGQDSICEDCMAKNVLTTKKAFQQEVKLSDGRGMDLRAIPIMGSDGEVELFVEWVKDISATKNTEEKIRYISFHDHLTGLYNRAYLQEEMQRLNTARQLPIAIIMVDVNGLKIINDTYGHHTGDKVLMKIAKVISRSCRQEDIIARWGGDEFLILLPQTTKSKAESICRRMVQNCKDVVTKGIPISISAGIAVKEENVTDFFDILKIAEDNMYQYKLTESNSVRNTILSAMLKALQEKSYETKQHVRNIQTMTLRMGIKLKLSQSELSRLYLVASLHDIGEINISEEILKKRGALTQQEWTSIKKHPEIGFRIASATEEFAHVSYDILSHHEHWDGSGYPRGMKGEAIPVLARIIAIADAYEVMSKGRPYKRAMSKKEIIHEFKRCAGRQFDPNFVKIFLKVIEEQNDSDDDKTTITEI